MDIKKIILWIMFILSGIMLLSTLIDRNQDSLIFPSLNFSMSKQEKDLKPNADLPTSIKKNDFSFPILDNTVSGKLIVLKNELISVEIDSLGGVIRKTSLSKHLDDEGKPITLLNYDTKYQCFGRTGLISSNNDELPNHTHLYEISHYEDNSVALITEKNGVRLEKIYTLLKNSYVLEVKHIIKIIDQEKQNKSVALYAELIKDNNKIKESMFYSTFTGPALYTDDDKFQKIKFEDIEKNTYSLPEMQTENKTAWIGMIQHYFASAWLNNPSTKRDFYVGQLNNNQYRIGIQIHLDSLSSSKEDVQVLRLFSGPQEERLLEKTEIGLELVKDYGWFTLLAKPIFWLLEKIHSIAGNWGWSIIILTILIKIVFFPLSAFSYRSMAQMKKIQPRLLELKTLYQNEPQKLNKSIMELYNKEKVNPLGGCFPILIQIPVFIALYWVLLSSIEIRNASWILWIQDLSKPDPYFVLPIIMAISMFVQAKISPNNFTDPLQAKLMMIMPIVFSIMFFFFPSGLVLYWVVNNILSIVQQWQINRLNKE